MFFITCLKIVSVILAIVGVSFFIPLAVAFYYGESAVYLPFIVPGAISIVLFAVIFLCTRRIKFHLSIKQTFVVVALSWIAASFMGSFPLYFSGCYPEYTNAFFESVSGFTTTGCTVCNDVESLPCSINMWRCLTHWLGGMGIVTLTVALLPLLGVGGFQLIKAETTGPEKGKVTARITTTAKILWLIYAGFTLLETLLLMACGMDFVEALSHGFSTLGTGGFSTRNSSIGAFNSVGIDVVITVFMFIAGVNFSLFFYLITRKFQDIYTNSEFKAYLLIVFVTVLVITFFLLPVYHSFGTSLRYSAFQVMALVTTTGFGTADYILWPAATQFFLFILFFIGGSSGSTSGGVKVIRWVVLGKQLGNETKKMLHPHGVFTIRLNGKPGRDDIVFNVTSFMFLYLLLVMITTFFGCLGNLDLTTSFTGALSIVGNVGPAFGNLGPSNNFSMVPEFVKWWYCFAMLAGRLELYTLVIFFIPSFWRKR